MHEARHEFKGVVAAPITPFRANGEINEDAYRRIIEFNIEAGIDGFWVAGGTGEMTLLDDDEVIRLAEITVDQAKGRAKSIIHVGAVTTRRAVRMAEGARKAGADAIACIPPYFFQPTDQAIVDHYRTVAGAADLPLFVYNLPMCTHVAMTPPLMENLIDGVPQLAGMKHSDFNMYYLNRFIDMDLAVYTGMMGFFLAALALGCCGGIDGPPNVAPEPFVEAYDSYLKGDLERAEKAQRRASRITNLIWTTSFATAFHSAYKTWMTARLGIDCGKPRPPLPELSGDQKKDFLRRMKELGGL